MITHRIVIYPKDIRRITGKTERYGRSLLCQIKVQFGKEDHQFVTIEEFCQFTGLDIEKVQLYLVD